MTTPRDLLIVAMDTASVRTVEPGDLSLAMAGAELIDLLKAGAVTLEGARIVPGRRPATGDDLLDEAASSLDRRSPYEPVGDWLWRRGRDLSAVYTAELETEGQLTRQPQRRWVFFRSSEIELVDSPARHAAAHRWAADEPVLTALATAVGLRDRSSGDTAPVADPAVSTVLTAVNDAVAELAAERHRRSRRLADAAADNVQRGY